MSTLIVPASIEGILRSALIGELGVAAAEIAATSEAHGCERHPEWFTDARTRFDAYCGLLDAIGWGDPPKRRTLEIDLHRHRCALVTALVAHLACQRDLLSIGLQTLSAQRQRRRAALQVRAIEDFLSGAGLGQQGGE